jgi:hypothetical protein
VLAKIKRDPDLKRIPVVSLTSSAAKQDILQTREPFLLSDFDLAEGNTDAGGRLSIDGTVRIPDLVMAPTAAPRVRSAIATTTAAVAHLVDARAPYWLAPRHTDDAGDPPLPT